MNKSSGFKPPSKDAEASVNMESPADKDLKHYV